MTPAQVEAQRRKLDVGRSDEETAARLGISVKTLRRMRKEGKGPKWIRVSERRNMTRDSDIDAYLAAGGFQAEEATA
jgi:predicted DNA-binding transcriptional regulator AlpA